MKEILNEFRGECKKCKETFHPTCSSCNQDISSFDVFTCHQNICSGFDINCSKCGETTDLSDLTLNYNVNKINVKAFHCNKCLEKFETHKKLINHHRLEHELRGDFGRIEKYLTCE